MIEAVNTIQIGPISMSIISKAFDKLHMLWMSIWMCPCHITAAHADQAFGSAAAGLEFGLTPRQQIMVKCGD
jgi:hypothetical protein